ncbi:MAG: hypothetical protein OEX18_15590, partial [Candidatus Krumholzibacteria bacterium]|nr:hypothetical protein [Candidatus Krumholzibacteria bacterium]
MTTYKRLIAILLCLFSICLVGYDVVHAGDYQEGDIYLVTNSGPGGVGQVVKIDPITGGTSILHTFPVASSRYATYDPFRDMLLVVVYDVNYPLKGVMSDGTTVSVGPSAQSNFGPRSIAARGDGKVYYIGGSQVRLEYLDASGAMHGVGGVSSSLINPITNTALMVYEPVTNALFVTCPTVEGLNYCSGVVGRTMVLKVPLNADGTALSGAIDCVERNVSYVNAEAPYGISLGPGGTIFVAVGTGTNDREPRLLTLNPESMSTLSVFAQNGLY